MTSHLKESPEIEGKVGWKSPSNIALIKYWGKKPMQIPQNPSLSLTLSASYTITEISYQRRLDKDWLHFMFHGKSNPAFGKKIENYLVSLQEHCPFIADLSFQIKSSNTFPHSSGIASSASSMSALALCLCSIEQNLENSLADKVDFFQKASFIARLGSGSACRSVYPHLALWGNVPTIEGTCDEYATPIEDIHPIFKTYHDDIIIVSPEVKSVSSSVGHDLMVDNPFAFARYQQAKSNLHNLLQAMFENNSDVFCDLVEEEALTLHALMMCSRPSYTLLKPGSLEIIDKIRKFRRQSGLPICFTLDAGPNVHVLYPEHVSLAARGFIDSQLRMHAFKGQVINDIVGMGPQKLDI